MYPLSFSAMMKMKCFSFLSGIAYSFCAIIFLRIIHHEKEKIDSFVIFASSPLFV